PIDARYPLRETPSADYPERTEWNVRDSDGTLVLTRGRPSGGTAFTIALARRHGRPLLVLDLEQDPDPSEVQRWTETSEVAVLNIAGPRESQQPGIQDEARRFLEEALGSSVAARP
ncbi:MAG: putative molybdenum carrier protein, partial [Acidobacteriota bacterium]